MAYQKYHTDAPSQRNLKHWIKELCAVNFWFALAISHPIAGHRLYKSISIKLLVFQAISIEYVRQSSVEDAIFGQVNNIFTTDVIFVVDCIPPKLQLLIVWSFQNDKVHLCILPTARILGSFRRGSTPNLTVSFCWKVDLRRAASQFGPIRALLRISSMKVGFYWHGIKFS